jgi:hypothetical protein
MHWKATRSVAGAAIVMAASLMLGCSGKNDRDGEDDPVRAASARARTEDNIHNIIVAMHHYHDATGALPLPASRDKDGKPLLSWRVHLLPYLEQQTLYKEFKLDEPWDSSNNIKLIEKMPKVFEAPYLPATKAGLTYLQVFTGKDTVFPSDKNARKGMTIQLIVAMDGAENTIMLSTAAKAVPWTAPEDIAFDKEAAIRPKLFLDKPFLLVGFCDGAVRSLKQTIDEKTLRALITPNGGEVVDPDDHMPKDE